MYSAGISGAEGTDRGRETLFSLPLVIFKDNSKHQSA